MLSGKDDFAEVCIAGRLMSIRDMGKASFAVLQDSVGKIQIYIRKDDVATGDDKSLYDIVWKKLVDIGDIIGVKGLCFYHQNRRNFHTCKRVFYSYQSITSIAGGKRKRRRNF
ncbi:MAG: OB-fold nucleic acid binding domain-containing protein [Chitinophagaceae bacterium]